MPSGAAPNGARPFSCRRRAAIPNRPDLSSHRKDRRDRGRLIEVRDQLVGLEGCTESPQEAGHIQGRLGRDRKPSLSRAHLESEMLQRHTLSAATVPERHLEVARQIPTAVDVGAGLASACAVRTACQRGDCQKGRCDRCYATDGREQSGSRSIETELHDATSFIERHEGKALMRFSSQGTFAFVATSRFPGCLRDYDRFELWDETNTAMLDLS